MPDLIFEAHGELFAVANNSAHARALARRKLAPLMVLDCERICEKFGNQKAPASFAVSLAVTKRNFPDSKIEAIK